MSFDPAIVIRLDGDSLVYQPGEILSGSYAIQTIEPDQFKAVEASVLWYTEGKGDEDMAVHEFWRRDADDEHPFRPHRPEPFRTMLPNSPLSYDGQIVKVRWCVRVRAFPVRGKELVAEKAFQLGEVAPPRFA